MGWSHRLLPIADPRDVGVGHTGGKLLHGMAGDSSWVVWAGEEAILTPRALGVTVSLAWATTAASTAEVATSWECVVAVAIAAGALRVVAVGTVARFVQEVSVHLGAVAHEAEEPAWL